MNEINIMFAISITISILIISLGLIFLFGKKINEEKVKSLATSTGMLFTFIGIFYGLYYFDTANIDESIPKLLDGLKTAFMTSIAGIFVSVIATAKEKYEVLNNENGISNEENRQIEMLEELKNLNKNLIGDGEGSLNTLLKSIDKNIGGEGNYSLVGQIKEMKQESSEQLSRLNNSFTEFAKEMANNNIDALTKAIEKVMGEFNETINDKLGETFDNFRKSVENLNEWQKEYKVQITEQTDNLVAQNNNLLESRMATEKVAEHIESITEDYQKIADINEKFDSVINKLNSQLEGSIEFADTMKELREDLEGTGNMIREEMKDITTTSLNEMETTMQDTLEALGSKLATISGKMAEDFERVQEMLHSINNRN